MADSSSNDQVKPLASFRLRSDDIQKENLSKTFNFNPNDQTKCIYETKYLTCFGSLAAIFLILAVTILVLMLTIFHVKDPSMKITKVTLQNQGILANGTLRTDVNVTLLALVCVNNPNHGAFKFNNGSTEVYYGGLLVGEGGTPQGNAAARSTTWMNVTMDIVPARLLEVKSFGSDLGFGSLNFSSCTVISGRVKIIDIMKRNLVVQTCCSLTYNISSQVIQGGNCRQI